MSSLEYEGLRLDRAHAEGQGTPPPDGLDYIRAVQCGGLLWARYQLPEGGQPGLLSMVRLYREWAELRASQAGQDTALALRDMIASRHDILVEATLNSARKAELNDPYYIGDVKACAVTAEAADFDIVIIGG